MLHPATPPPAACPPQIHSLYDSGYEADSEYEYDYDYDYDYEYEYEYDYEYDYDYDYDYEYDYEWAFVAFRCIPLHFVDFR